MEKFDRVLLRVVPVAILLTCLSALIYFFTFSILFVIAAAYLAIGLVEARDVFEEMDGWPEFERACMTLIALFCWPYKYFGNDKLGDE